MKLSYLDLKIKLQNHFHNNPKRIALAWIYAHVFFLVVGLIGTIGQNMFIGVRSIDVFIGLAVGILAFPNFFLGFVLFYAEFITPPIVGLAVSATYYSLFAFMVYNAKNTQSKNFKITFLTFTVWFLLSLAMGLYSVFPF